MAKTATEVKFETIDKEIILIREDLRDFLLLVGDMKRHKEDISKHSKRFGEIFKVIAQIEKTLASNSTSIKIYFSLLAILGPILGAVIVKFILP